MPVEPVEPEAVEKKRPEPWEILNGISKILHEAEEKLAWLNVLQATDTARMNDASAKYGVAPTELELRVLRRAGDIDTVKGALVSIRNRAHKARRVEAVLSASSDEMGEGLAEMYYNDLLGAQASCAEDLVWVVRRRGTSQA